MDKPASRHFSVLIIDDEPQVTSELRELLENSGYRCVTSTHRESAIASFQADPNIGLVICDLYLGQDNGIRLIEASRKSPAMAGSSNRSSSPVTMAARK